MKGVHFLVKVAGQRSANLLRHESLSSQVFYQAFSQLFRYILRNTCCFLISIDTRVLLIVDFVDSFLKHALLDLHQWKDLRYFVSFIFVALPHAITLKLALKLHLHLNICVYWTDTYYITQYK